MASILWNVKTLAEVWRAWQENKFDGIVVFDGNRGLGKSTGAVKCALRFKEFKIKRDVIFSRDEVMKAMAKYHKGVIVADEMINVTFNRDFYGEEQKKLIKMLNMYRDRYNILIACVPNFYSLDSQFRSLVKMRINVIRRGLAVIHTPNQSSFSTDKWDSKYNEKIERSWIKKKSFNFNYKKMTTFRGVFKYTDLPRRQRELYEKIKEEKRSVLMDGELDNKETSKDVYEDIIEKLKEGILNKERLLGYCVMNGLKYTNVVCMLNKKLKDQGVPYTLSTLLLQGQKETDSRTISGRDRNQTQNIPISV